MDKMYKRLLKPPSQSFFLFGARGTGKSTWLKYTFPDAIYIDLLEERRYQKYLVDSEQFVLDICQASSDQWVVVDEIQRLPHLLNEVHRAIENQKIKFALSGSSARKLKRKDTNLLAGRAINKEMHPFLPQELGDDFSLDTALRFGTIPVIWTSPDREAALEAYAHRYLKEEIQAEALVRNIPLFGRFLPISALMHGQVLSISSLARDSGVHRNTVANYIDILEDTLIAFRLPAFEAKARVKERKHPKFYLIDPGLVRALKKYSGKVAEEEKGALLEGWIASFLRSYNSYNKFFDDWFYWSTRGSAKVEVDFLLRFRNSFIAIEVKSSKTVSKKDFQGLKAISDLKGLKRKIIVYLGKDKQKTHSGIEILPITDFIKEIQKGLF
ncbi:MAG: ATP-binding protein [Candidatus Dadabacteria bacterium]|nr:MAG: ATP-binding protein [Candidatus Dadabacteria bacterium]